MLPDDSPLPSKICFVDVETSGGSPIHDRVIEIGVLRIENNRVVRKFSSLVNPETRVPPFILSMTGIDPDKLEAAPTFYALKDELLEILKDSVFMAHNVRFDYNFLRHEFKRHNLNFTSRHACTVKLFRALYPQLQHHDLDSVISQFSISCARRHRAFDDAKVLWHFYRAVTKKFPHPDIARSLKEDLRHPTLPPHMSEKDVSGLPESPGVYIFYARDGAPLYIGKSINLKERVMSHFSGDHTSPKELRIKEQLYSIETIPTAGQIGALILESQLVKKLQPLYNRQLRFTRRLHVHLTTTNSQGLETLTRQTLDVISPDLLPRIAGVHKSVSDSKKFLQSLVYDHQLCPRVLGLEKGKGGCFAYHLNQCKGVCVGKEDPLRYNLRFKMAISSRRITTWPFPGPVVITEESPFFEGTQSFVVDQWCLISSPTKDKEESLTLIPAEFDVDIYRIFRKFLLKNRNSKNVRLYREGNHKSSKTHLRENTG